MTRFGGGSPVGALGVALALSAFSAFSGCDGSSDDGRRVGTTAGRGGAGGQAGSAAGTGSGGAPPGGNGGSTPAGGNGGTQGGSGGGSSGGAGEGGSAGQPTPPSGLRPECPTTVPNNGVSCSDDGIQCQYGTDPRRECRPVAVCNRGSWSVTATPAVWCPELVAVDCPDTMAALSGMRCVPGPVSSGPYCRYQDVTCFCDVDTCDASDCDWFCERPLDEPDCPWGEPNVGTSCTTPEGTACRYTGCRDHHCEQGYWVATDNGACPPTLGGS